MDGRESSARGRMDRTGILGGSYAPGRGCVAEGISLAYARETGHAVEVLRVAGMRATAYAGPESAERIELGSRFLGVRWDR